MLFVTGWAHADDKQAAKEAYDRGLAAHDRGDLSRAAEEFARADALAPSTVALQAALDAAIDADDPVIGAELLERSKREPAPAPALAKLVAAARNKFAGRTGTIRVVCPTGATCLAKVDDRAVTVGAPTVVRTGQRTVVLQVDGEAQTKLIVVESGKSVDVAPSARPAAEPPPPLSPKAHVEAEPVPRKLPPIVFYVGVGGTLVLAGATAFFALDTRSKHDSFENAGCPVGNFAPCEDLKEQGEDSRRAANIGFIATPLVAVATIVIGAAFTDWGPRVLARMGQAGKPIVAIQPNGGRFGWEARF
jgi:hypothetical protein